MQSASSEFQGRAEDYINWGKSLDYEKKNKIVLPPTLTHLIAAQNLSKNKEEQLKYSIPKFRQGKSEKSYVESYVNEHANATNEVFPSSPSQNYHFIKSQDNLEDLSTTEFTDCSQEEEENSDKVQSYLHYDFSKYDEKSALLPVSEHRKDILQKIASYPVLVVHGQTGSGKSTQVPQYILDDAVHQHIHANIVVTQPRKIAAITLAKRVCEERQWECGKIVGYQVGLNKEIDHTDTRLTYMTTEVLIQKIIHRKSLNEFTHIILDEVHERDQHTDFALLLVKKLLHTVSRNVKIILMSATIDVDKFASYFSTPIQGQPIPAPIMSVGNETVYSLEITYLDIWRKHCENKKVPAYSLSGPGISPEMYKLAIKIIEDFDKMEYEQLPTSNPKGIGRNRGAVLVFVPGLIQIEEFIHHSQEIMDKFKWECYPLHSTLTVQEQKMVFCIPKPGYRKIIISTNIAESSVTVIDVKYVIDFCLTKVLKCDPITNYTCLKMSWASKTSCTQRAGRAGRVSKGKVIRLVEQQFYNRLDEYTTPEMCRTPLFQTILNVKVLDMGPPEALLALALDPPNLEDIYRSILVLKQIGALGLRNNGLVSHIDGQLTPLGQIASSLPLDPHLSKLIVLGYIFGCYSEAIIIAASLSLKSFHSTPFQDELNAHLAKSSWDHGCLSDCIASLHAYVNWNNEFNTTKSNIKTPTQCKKEVEWARKSYIQLESLKEVARLVKEIRDRLERLNIHRGLPQKSLGQQDLIIKICLAGAFYPNYFKRSCPPDYERCMLREMNNRDVFSTLLIGGLPPSGESIFYDSQIKQLFWPCSQDLRICYENTKAFIIFNNRKSQVSERNQFFSEIPGTVPTAMHLALKLRQLPRNKLQLKLYSNDEIRALKQTVTLDGGDGIKREFDAQASTLEVVAASHQLKDPVKPTFLVNRIRVFVTSVEQPDRLYVVSYDNDSYDQMMYVTNFIECALENEDIRSLPTNLVHSKSFCLAPFWDRENIKKWYRARIDEVYPNQDTVSLYFVDYGNTGIAHLKELKLMPEELKEIPMLALRCALCRIKPHSKSAQEYIWSDQATEFLVKKAEYQDFQAEVFSVVQGALRIELFEGNEKTGDWSSVNEMMINAGLVDTIDEPILSEQNHSMRKNFGSCYEDEKVVQCVVGSKAKPQLEVRKRIQGPYSPLEMKFVALTMSGNTKEVAIDMSSVNSPALDLQPQSSFDRLIVSAFTVLNPSETRVVLRSTTMMPNLPGVLSLTLLLFSPTVEFRTNKRRTRYSGALIGLGCDEEGVPVYPDDDMEVAFDIKLHRRDITEINRLRYMMSQGINTIIGGSINKLANFQNNFRTSLLGLFDSQRKYKEPEFCGKAYRWEQIPKIFLEKPNVDDEDFCDSEEDLVYRLHQPVIFDQCIDPVAEKKEKIKRMKDFYNRLCDDHYPDSQKVRKCCPICEGVKINDFGELKFHMNSIDHHVKENKLNALA